MPATLRNGSSGNEVRDAQRKLRSVGFTSLLVDGNFGNKMEAAVRTFQQTHNSLAVTGIVDDQTWAVMDQAAGG